MKKFEGSVSVFCEVSSKFGALLCLMAVTIFSLPVAAQRVSSREESVTERPAKRQTSVENSLVPTAEPVIYAYNDDQPNLISFNAANPTVILSDVFLDDIASVSESLSCMDFRPSNGVLYAIHRDNAPPGFERLVTIDLNTGNFTTVGSPSILPGLYFGCDFNPIVDLLREVSKSGGNRRLNPNDGTVAGVDTNLAYAPGDPNFGQQVFVNHVAYLGSTLYGIDVGPAAPPDVRPARLVTIGSPFGSPVSPNSGQVFTVGPLGGTFNNSGGFDIQRATGKAYAILRTTTSPVVSRLYRINLATGAATDIGGFDEDLNPLIDGMSIAPGGTFSADLAITKTDNFTTYVPGSVRPYTITVTNNGPDPVAEATVTDTMTAQFSNFSWTCTGTGGGMCPASGTGSINVPVHLPVGATVTFQLQATVASNATGTLVNNASVTTPQTVFDSNAGNSAAVDANAMLTTAAGVMVSGRVMAPDGRGLRGARVTIVDSAGIARSVYTSSLGYYTFDDLELGETYIVGVGARQFRFDSRVVQVSDSLTEVDFIGIQ